MKLEIIDVSKDEVSYTPLTEPVTLTEAKAWCLVDFADDDTLLTSIIGQGRKAMEDYCHISICPKTIFLTARTPYPLANVDPLLTQYRWDASFYGWPINYDWSELPYGPVASVQSVTAIDPTGAITLLSLNSDYYLTGSNPTNQGFQQIRINMWYDHLLIQYFTPYYCPAPLKEAILNEIAFRYENRGAGLNRYANQNVGVSEGAQALAQQYVRRWL